MWRLIQNKTERQNLTHVNFIYASESAHGANTGNGPQILVVISVWLSSRTFTSLHISVSFDVFRPYSFKQIKFTLTQYLFWLHLVLLISSNEPRGEIHVGVI